MTINEVEKIKIFCCCARKDCNLYTRLKTHFASIKKTYHLEMRSNCDIEVGKEWQKVIDDSLSNAHLIFLLFSVDFINSDYYDEIMHCALEQHTKGEAKVIPILLRPCDWKETPISRLWVLPKDGKAVIKHKDIDQAFIDIVHEIKPIIKKINEEINKIKSRSKEEWLKDANNHYRGDFYTDALKDAESAIICDDNYVDAYIVKGEALQAFKLDEKTLQALKKDKCALKILKLDEETLTKEALEEALTEGALAAYYKVFCLNPENIDAYMEIPRLLLKLNSGIVKTHSLDPKDPGILDQLQHLVEYNSEMIKALGLDPKGSGTPAQIQDLFAELKKQRRA